MDLPKLQDHIFIERVITLVDVKNIKRVARAVMFVEDQIRSADVLIINKIDLVDEGLRVKFVPGDDALKQCFDLGLRVAEKTKGLLEAA